MKTKLLILHLFVSTLAFGQFNLTAIIGGGISNHFNHQEQFWNSIGLTLNPIPSMQFGTEISYQKHPVFQPFAGLLFQSIGSLYKTSEIYHLKPNDSFLYRFNYVSIPVGVRIPVYKGIGGSIAIINSFQISNPNEQPKLLPESKTYDFAIQPGVYAQVKQWQFGIDYYWGFSDVFGLGEDGGLDDLRFFNRTLFFNIAYQLHSF